jgi:hypothetical protein
MKGESRYTSLHFDFWIFSSLVKIHKLISFIKSNCNTCFYLIFLKKGNFLITIWIQDYVFWFMLLTLHSLRSTTQTMTLLLKTGISQFPGGGNFTQGGELDKTDKTRSMAITNMAAQESNKPKAKHGSKDNIIHITEEVNKTTDSKGKKSDANSSNTSSSSTSFSSGHDPEFLPDRKKSGKSQNKRRSAIPSNSSGRQEALEGESQGKRKCTKSSI